MESETGIKTDRQKRDKEADRQTHGRETGTETDRRIIDMKIKPNGR